MDGTHPRTTSRVAPILAAVLATLVAASACGAPSAGSEPPPPTEGDEMADAIATSVAATLAAAPSPTSPPAILPSVEATATEPGEIPACPFPFPDLVAISTGYLSGGRFMVTLQNPGPFLDPQYILMVNENPYPCAPLTGQPENRVFCIGQPLPPLGHIPAELLSGDSSCRIEIPFDTVLVLPVPQPTSAGGYSYP